MIDTFFYSFYQNTRIQFVPELMQHDGRNFFLSWFDSDSDSWFKVLGTDAICVFIQHQPKVLHLKVMMQFS